MKKFACVCLGILMSLGAFAFAACGENQNAAESCDDSRSQPAAPSVNGKEQFEDAESGYPSVRADDKVSPLAALDKIEIADAFGDSDSKDWSFALRATGNADYSYDLKWTSEITDSEKFYIGLSAGANIDDTFGIRSAKDGEGIDLFGGGKAGVDIGYTAPKSDSEPRSKSFDVGFRHDGDLILYTDTDGTEKSITVSALSDKANAEFTDRAMQEIAGAVMSIPEDVKKGLSLRLAVENLIELGFTAEIDDSQGLTVRLVATHGFFTGLLNDMLEELLPEDLLTYIPRADFGYSSTDFEITLAFDESGLFKEYSFSSDAVLSFSLEVRRLFVCESHLKFGCGMSVEAYYGETPGFGEQTEG